MNGVTRWVGAAGGERTTVRGVFDGWGYARLFRVDIPAAGTGTIEQLDTYAIRQSQTPPRFAAGSGDLSVHEVEVYQRDGLTFVLASDRDFGLYILQPGA